MVEVGIIPFSPYTVAGLTPLVFRDKFQLQIVTGSPERGRQTRAG